MLSQCRFCSHLCGVNRNAGERSPCGAGPQANYFCAQIEIGDERELLPTFAVALSGCDLRCRFCNSRASSWNASAGVAFVPSEIAGQAVQALESGARTVMVLGGEPTIHLPSALELVAALPESATLVWKTNACGSPEARELLAGMFDVWLADYKFGNDACAGNLASAANYTQIVQDNLVWATEHTSLIVRHLVMPGHLDCCWRPIAEWLASVMPEVKISLRTQFWPLPRGTAYPELRRTVTEAEAQRAFDIAHDYHLNLVP